MPCNKHKWKAELGKMASLSRLSITDTEQEVEKLRGVLDRITANEERAIRVFSSPKATISSRQVTHIRTYGEFVCTAESSPAKGESEVLRLKHDGDLDRITAHLKKAFHLVGGALIILPEDRLCNGMKQLVLSSTHFQSLLNDFVLRLPTRRMLKVIRVTLPILHNLVGGSHNDEAREDKTLLALNQLFELAQVPGNLDTMDRGGFLRKILIAVVSVVERSMCPVLVATACKVVWKLAKSVDLRKCMLDCGLQDALWELLESIVRVVESPERRKAREKAATTAADTVVDAYSGGAIDPGEQTLEGTVQVSVSVHSRAPLELVAGTELDELAVNSLGAVSQILRLELAKEALARSPHHAGLDILFELATVAQGRGTIGDARVPSMAAEALAIVLISHGSCRVDWAQHDRLLSVVQLLSSEPPRVVLCGASILNACLRGEPWQIVVSPRDAVKILERASGTCQRCLDQLKSTQPSAVPRAMTGVPVTASAINLALRLRAHEDTHELINTLEQATAVCWGSLAVIERCPPGPNKPSVSPEGWLSTMLTVAKLAGSPWMPRWVTLCALASIGLGVSAAAHSGNAAISNIESISHDMLDILRRTNVIDLQEHAARALCTILGDNQRLRRKAVQDGFLDKLQKLLMRRLGSARLDSTIACSIMLLCDVDTDDGSDDFTGWTAARRSKKASMGTEGEDIGLLTQKQMTSLVWALGHSNQDVLAYTAWTMWLLARRPENRTSLGRLWAIDGLVGALGSTAKLTVKEGLLAAIWLLACDVANTTRIALNGGMQVLVGILNFADKPCYVPLKTLAVGTLCMMCHFEPDVGALGMQLSLAPTLLQAMYSNVSTVYLKILSAGLIFTLCRNAEHEEHRADHLQSFTAESGQFFLEEMCVHLLSFETSELQACGAFFAASLSLNARSRHYFLKTGGVEALCRLIQSGTTSEPLRLRCLHALLNLSTEPDCQVSICKWAFQSLIELIECGKSPSSPPLSLTQSDFSASILVNCMDNPICRSTMFQAQLARGSREVFDVRSAQTLQEPIQALLWANSFGDRNKGASQMLRERFLAWVQEIKGGVVDAVRNNRDTAPVPDFSGRFRKPTPHQAIQKNDSRQNGSAAEDEHGSNKPTLVGPKSNKSIKTKSTTRWNVESAMAKIRFNMRQPVTSLWQDETERARTAPSRNPPSTWTRDLILRLPSPQGGQARASESSPHEKRNPTVRVGVDVATNTRASGEGHKGDKNGIFRAMNDEARGQIVGDGSRGTGRPIPLRSSHRIGPVGDMGSSRNVIGENRWKPFVSKFFTKPNPLPAWRCKREPATTIRVNSTGKVDRSPSPPSASDRNTSVAELTHQERDAAFGQAIKEHQTMVVMEPPMNYKIVFNGPATADPPKPLSSSVSMALFPHARGASVCAPLYEHYVSEDGLCYHLYHTSRVVCEVLDPGGYPPLSEPTKLQYVLQKSLPEAPPKGKPDAKPALYLPPTRESPAITAHYVTLCKVACRQAHGGGPCPGEKCKMFGAMPSDFLVFEVGEDPPKEAENDHTLTTNTDSSVWDVNRSIFASRRKEAESRSFWDTDCVVQKALDTDFARMLKEDRVLKYLAKADAAVVNGEKTVSESLEEVKESIAPFYKTLLAIFDFYCLTSSQSVRGAFSIQPNQFYKLMQDAEFPGDSISVEEIGKIFVLVNYESDKRSADAEINEDRALMRFELMEALLRVAITVRDNEGQEKVPPAQKLRSMIEDQLLTALPLEAMEQSDTFRNESLYTQACDSVFQDHRKPLLLVYQRYSLLDPVAGKPCFGLEEWKTFTSHARLVGDNVFMLRLGLREMKHPFYLARTMVSDEFKNRTKMTQLTFVDFMEALARLAIAMPIPSDQDMKDAQVTDIMDYETALIAGYETTPEYHAIVAAAIGGPVAPRLERLIRYILGTLAIRLNGMLKAGNKKIKLVGQYCTKAHIARGILS